MTKSFEPALAPNPELKEELTEELKRRVLALRESVDERLDHFVPAADAPPAAIHAAMRWSLFAGGKRLRPVLLILAGDTFGAPLDRLLPTACAFELIHTYSLIHDDLPAMDNDDLRRGQPTCHVRYGEATAILAGDALQALAFQIIAADEGLTPDVRLRLVGELARAAGTPHGMVAGQAADLEAESRAVDGAELEAIHRRKTGALITAAATSGAVIAGANVSEISSIARYADRLGLLFQITDDLLDVLATAADLGKTPGKDARARKATYPALYGLAQARARAEQVYEQACAALREIGPAGEQLGALARLILERRA
ncbi:MAG TPA: farnesyl diphosphate synthase [Pyrinomonadaceae bacterium]|nr:farnesyl diphosphate synthase [Pyrinomonadaceae bacterium]